MCQYVQFTYVIYAHSYDPFIWQVFLDEVNTSSCLGLFKEIIVDRTFDGEVCIMMYNCMKLVRGI